MPFDDAAAQHAALDAIVGTFDDTWVWRLFNGNPKGTGAELTTDGGYEPAAHAVADWAAATGLSVTTTAPVEFAESTDAWSDPATWWALTTADGTVIKYYDELDDPIIVSAAGITPTFSPSIFFKAP